MICIEKGADLLIVLDAREVHVDDPGEGAPAMVYKEGDEERAAASATFNTALNTGELRGRDGVVDLTPGELDWLDDQFDRVRATVDGWFDNLSREDAHDLPGSGPS